MYAARQSRTKTNQSSSLLSGRPDAGYDSAARYADSPYEQYTPQAFGGHDASKFAQLNQQSFASNNAVAQYLPHGPAVLSYQPTSGLFGTKVFLRVSSPYDLFSMAPSMTYVALLFGSQRCPVQDLAREGQEGGSFVYSCSADAPQLLATGCGSPNVPLVLVIEGPTGEELSRTVVGAFQYLESAPATGPEITGPAKGRKHDSGAPPGHEADQPGDSSPKGGSDDPAAHHAPAPSAVPSLGGDAGTNTAYDYPPQQGQYASSSTPFAPDSSTAGDMITTTYRSSSSSFTDPSHHHRHQRPASAWGPYAGTQLVTSNTGRHRHHRHQHGDQQHHHPRYAAGGLPNPGLAPLPMPMSSSMSSLIGSSGCESATPMLVRTSTIPGSAGAVGGAGALYPMSPYPNKAVLKIHGRLETMTKDWTPEECQTRRRIVVFRKSQSGAVLTASFRAVPLNERPPSSICVSCIYWRERDDFYVTSVDTIQLLEQLVVAPHRFTVEEKNRIRRNLEGFHPLTVAKGRGDSEEFFKVIMGFPNPKPRNIEKDVKVFKWTDLEPALKKIISKYSASPSSTVPPPGSTMITASSSTTASAATATVPYNTLPTPPGQSLPSQHPADPHGPYAMHAGHDAIPSPRSLSGSQPGWNPYGHPPPYAAGSGRTLSPGLRNPSPHQQQLPPPMRISANTTPLPAVTSYDSRTMSGSGYAGGAAPSLHTHISHHPQQSAATPPRWEPSAHPSYADGYPTLSSQHGSVSSHPVYGSAGYGEGTPRV